MWLMLTEFVGIQQVRSRRVDSMRVSCTSRPAQSNFHPRGGDAYMRLRVACSTEWLSSFALDEHLDRSEGRQSFEVYATVS